MNLYDKVEQRIAKGKRPCEEAGPAGVQVDYKRKWRVQKAKDLLQKRYGFRTKTHAAWM